MTVPSRHSKMSILFTCPNEVLCMIAHQLRRVDLLAFRLTSRRVCNIIQPAFIKICFRTRYVMLQQRSLENILEISQHPSFSPAVRTLGICVDYLRMILFDFSTPGVFWRRGRLRREREGSNHNWDVYEHLWDEQECTIHSGLAVLYLSRSFAAFKNLECLEITNAHRPWGAKAQKELTGSLPTNTIRSEEDFESISVVRQAIYRVLISLVSVSSSLEELRISVGNSGSMAVAPCMLEIPKPCLRYFRCRPVGISRLSLRICPVDLNSEGNGWIPYLLDFIALFIQLRELKLVFKPLVESEHFTELAQTLRVQHLRSLTIEGVHCTQDVMTGLLLGHRDTLEVVKLASVTMADKGDSWKSLLCTMRDEFSIQSCIIADCAGANGSVQYVLGGCDEGLQEEFEIRGNTDDWTTVIDKIMMLTDSGSVVDESENIDVEDYDLGTHTVTESTDRYTLQPV
ncbi:hypothetical protein F4810DRAFT_676813 [Camillea tinctor]|nr:hypothetical protein F4810DRAFT_676813 [Camillea tinctor]